MLEGLDQCCQRPSSKRLMQKQAERHETKRRGGIRDFSTMDQANSRKPAASLMLLHQLLQRSISVELNGLVGFLIPGSIKP
jgi:hypothetical protein